MAIRSGSRQLCGIPECMRPLSAPESGDLVHVIIAERGADQGREAFLVGSPQLIVRVGYLCASRRPDPEIDDLDLTIWPHILVGVSWASRSWNEADNSGRPR